MTKNSTAGEIPVFAKLQDLSSDLFGQLIKMVTLVTFRLFSLHRVKKESLHLVQQ